MKATSTAKKTTPKKKSRLSKNVFTMGWVSFFNDISSEAIYPLVPIFLTSILGVPVTIVGLIEGVAESTGNIFKVIFGWISDKLQKRKPLIILGYLLTTSAKILLGLSYVWTLVFAARFFDRLGKGIRTSAKDALIAESSTTTSRGISFGFTRTLDTAGATIGSLIAIIFIKIIPNNFHAIFFLAAIPGFIGILIFATLVKEKRKKPLAKPLSFLKLNNFGLPFKLFTLISCIFAIGNSSNAFLILRAKNLGLSVIMILLAYTTFNLTYALFSAPAGSLSDRIGSKKVLLIGFFLFGLVYLFFGLLQKPALLWVLFPIYGIYMALTDGVGKAYISHLVPEKNLGVAYGLYQTTTGICMFFASLIAGLLWSHVNVQAPFIFSGVTALASGIIFWLI